MELLSQSSREAPSSNVPLFESVWAVESSESHVGYVDEVPSTLRAKSQRARVASSLAARVQLQGISAPVAGSLPCALFLPRAHLSHPL